jgi:hypothetical protein
LLKELKMSLFLNYKIKEPVYFENKRPGMVVHIYNPSTQEAQTGGSEV